MAEARADVRNADTHTIARRRAGAGRSRPARDHTLPAAILEAAQLPLDPPLPDVRLPMKKPHWKAAHYAVDVLEERFPKAEVAEETDILFSEAGMRGQSRLRPDMFVALSVPRSETLADFDIDELGAPDFVLEVLSRTTWRLDLGRKLDCYQKLGVRECLFFDPTGEDLAGNGKELWGYALTASARQPLAEGVLANGERYVSSEVLGLVAYVLARVPPARAGETWALRMRWRDPATDADLPYFGEVQAEAVAQRERAQAAENERDVQKMLLAAEQERASAAEERLRTEQARAEAALAKVAELGRMLRPPRP